MIVKEFLGSKSGLAACLLVAVLGGYLLLTHTGHVLAAIPYLFLLACPLLHFFGHSHGHGGHHPAAKSDQSQTQN